MTKQPADKYVLGPDVDLEQEDVRDSRGRRITPEYAEQAATEALERVRPRGRPSLTGKAGARSPSVSFRLTPEERARAERVAAQEGKTVSALAREALERYLSERRGA